MLKLNSNYSDYTDETDENYPEGKAVNASSSESYDGTPLLAEFMNDVNAAHIAMYEKAYGSRDGINGQADTQKKSQFADSVAKYTDDKVKAHADKRGLADGVHGATSEATPGQIVSRDQFGRAKVAAPVENDDIANKKWVLEAIYPVGSLYWSSVSTNPSQLFGGTWVQIKDCFVWAKGDSDAINATGGSKTVTLREANMPSHSHSFTPSGTITMNAHSHGVGEHRHSFSWSGRTDNESAHEKFSWSGTHTHSIAANTKSSHWDTMVGTYDIYASGIVFSGYKDAFENSSYQTKNTKFDPIINFTNIDISGTCTGDHTHELKVSGSTDGTSGNTTSETATGSFKGSAGITESNGSGTDFSIMPPYVVKYCFERIA